MRPKTKSRLLVVCAVLLFAATRIALYLAVQPYFDPESYRYLAAADSLRAGGGLSPAFTHAPTVGGTLDAVPGYPWMVRVVWGLSGEISLTALTVVQSLVTLIGFLALAQLFAEWTGRAAATALFVVLCLSPSLAWIEHSLLPDALTAPLYMIAIWCAFMAGPDTRRSRRSTLGAVGAGLAVAVGLLLRASSIMYVIFPPLLTLQSRPGRRAMVRWMAVYTFSVVVAVMPLLLHNLSAYGSFSVSRSFGRNLYASAAWGGTIDRQRVRDGLDAKIPTGPEGSIALTNAALARAFAERRSFAAADAALRDDALAAYATQNWTETIAQRLAILAGLFVHDQEVGASLLPLQSFKEWYLGNNHARAGIREGFERRSGYHFSDEFETAAERSGPLEENARTLYSYAIDYLTLDGTALLIVYLLSIVTIYWRSLARRQILSAIASPPAVFLVGYVFLGIPLYRYQAGLHALMLATFVAAIIPLLTREPRRRSVPSLLQRRLRRG